MKYFTPDLLARFGSEDDGIALAAQEELERRAAAYDREFHAIEGRLPRRFREFLGRFYLHDALVLALGPSTHPALMGPTGLSSENVPFDWLDEAPSDPASSIRMALRLDVPDGDIFLLDYGRVSVELIRPTLLLPPKTCPYLEWLNDEIELLPPENRNAFRHSILFTNDIELRIAFDDFDFKPVTNVESFQQAAST